MTSTFTFRRAEITDTAQISRFLSSNPRIHRHLDWHPPLEWLGSQPFWLSLLDQQVIGAIATPPDPPGVAWVRLFACNASTNPVEIWDELFSYCLSDPALNRNASVATLTLSDWYTLLIRRTGFNHYQDIVGLEREIEANPPAIRYDSGLFIRIMEPADIKVVAEIDQRAFEPIWQNSFSQVKESYDQAAIATVAEYEDEIVGYQISTINMFTAHLARLAVRPGVQNRQIGSQILKDLFQRCKNERLWQVTVNTQDNNYASLALYQKNGFVLTGEHFPVYVYQKNT